MTFREAIDLFMLDMTQQGRIRSPRSERSYRDVLLRHAEDVENRDPAKTGRTDVKRTLARWPHPNSRSVNHSVLRSFYDWAMEEGHRKDNPARQVRKARRRETSVYRLTHGEALKMLGAVKNTRERRAIYLGICAGLRNRELRGLRGRHFQREGWVWVSPDIAKGERERWVPVIADLEPIVAEIRENVGPDEYVLPAQRFRDVGFNREQMDKAKWPSSAQSLYYLVKRVGKRAGIAAPVHPHLLRHAFADLIARFAGMRNAQALLGHKTIGTTEGYLSKPAMAQLAEAVAGFSLGYPPETPPVSPLEATAGIEPAESASRVVERLLAPQADKIALYVAHFRGLA